jgi:hypothetical protein
MNSPCATATSCVDSSVTTIPASFNGFTAVAAGDLGSSATKRTLRSARNRRTSATGSVPVMYAASSTRMKSPSMNPAATTDR